MSKAVNGIQVDSITYPPVSNSPPPRKLLSHLPLFRYTTATIILVTIDSLLSISLWIAGGNSQYLEESIEDFSLYKSTFDLAVMAAIRGVLLIGCLYYLEHYTLTAVSTKVEQTQITSQRLAWACHAVLLMLPLASLIYAVVKLVLILVKSMESFKHDLHIAYRILCVVGVTTPLLELVLGLLSFHFMWKLVHVLKVRRLLQEEQGNTDKKKSKANFGRLMKLAFPVSGSVVHVHVDTYISPLLNISPHIACTYTFLMYHLCMSPPSTLYPSCTFNFLFPLNGIFLIMQI